MEALCGMRTCFQGGKKPFSPLCYFTASDLSLWSKIIPPKNVCSSFTQLRLCKSSKRRFFGLVPHYTLRRQVVRLWQDHEIRGKIPLDLLQSEKKRRSLLRRWNFQFIKKRQKEHIFMSMMWPSFLAEIFLSRKEIFLPFQAQISSPLGKANRKEWEIHLCK